MILDNVYKTWTDIESKYNEAVAKGQSIDRVQFLTKLIGGKDSLPKLRNLIAKDFVSTEENIEKLNTLFDALERAAATLEHTTQIDNLTDFVWKQKNEIFYLNMEDYTLAKKPTFLTDEEVLAQKVFASRFSLNGKNKISIKNVNFRSDKLLIFPSMETIYSWALEYANVIGSAESNRFYDKVYLVVVSKSKEGLQAPAVFADASLVEKRVTKGNTKRYAANINTKSFGSVEVKADTSCYNEHCAGYGSSYVEVTLVN